MEESEALPVSETAQAESTSSSPSDSHPPERGREQQQLQSQTTNEEADADTSKSTPNKGKQRQKDKDNHNKSNNKAQNQSQQKKPKMPPRPTPTHFLCIPLVTASSRPQLTRSLAAFREEVTAPNPSSAYGALPVPDEAIRPVGTIHLTLGVMSFMEPKVHKKGAARHQHHGGAERNEREDGRAAASESRERSRSGSRSGSEEKGGSLDGLRKLEEAKALLRSLKLREIWQEVLRQSQTQATAVPEQSRDSLDSTDGGAPIVAIGTTEEKGEGVEAGPGTVVRDVQPRSQPGTGGEDLKITLRGLHSMQSPSKATVLYAPPVDPLGHLQRFCEKVKDAFVQKGLMMEEGGRPLLLHATVVNTIYVKGRNSQQQAGGKAAGGGGGGGGGKKGHHGHRGGGNRRERLTIDAREILERYEDYTWMEDVKVETVAICRMGAKKELGVGGVVVDEAYEVEEEVEF